MGSLNNKILDKDIMTVLNPTNLAIKQSSSSSLSSKKLDRLEGVGTPFKEILVSPVDSREGKKGDLFALIEEELEEESNPLIEASMPLPFMSQASLSSLESCSASLSSFQPSLPLVMEKMVGTLILMHCTGETHTTLVLDQPQFSNSPFFGTQITIKEFTAAPKTFNIEISSNQAALLSIQKGSEQLLSLFKKGDFGFSVHRLDLYSETTHHSAYPDDEGKGGNHHQESNEDQDS